MAGGLARAPGPPLGWRELGGVGGVGRRIPMDCPWIVWHVVRQSGLDLGATRNHLGHLPGLCSEIQENSGLGFLGAILD